MAQNIHIQSIAFGDNNDNCGNTIGSYNTTVYSSDEDAKIMHWLSPLEPDKRHDSLRTDRFDGVGNWLLETSKFREWREGEGGVDQAVLFCSGDPGVGKTHLRLATRFFKRMSLTGRNSSSLVIDRLCDQAKEEDLAVAWLYCDYNIQQEQTVVNTMGAIVKQLVNRAGISKDIREEFKEAKKFGGRRPLLVDLMRMLRIAIAKLPQVFICVDALDECLPKDLLKLLESLRDIVRESPGTRIFLTGRPHVGGAIQNSFTKAIVIPITPNEDDIRNYVKMRLDGDNTPEAMDNRLRSEIVRTIVDKMSNMCVGVSPLSMAYNY